MRHYTSAFGSPAAAEADAALRRSLQLSQQKKHQQNEGTRTAFFAEVALWRGDPDSARSLADRAWELAAAQRNEADFIRAARLQGTAALRCWSSGFNRPAAEPSSQSAMVHRDSVQPPAEARTPADAHERLHHALTRARACQRVEEEIPTLIALAELHLLQSRPYQAQRRSGSSPRDVDESSAAGTAQSLVRPTADNVAGSPTGSAQPETLRTSLHGSAAEHLAQARELLNDVWDRADAGPYPLFHADALNILAAIEIAEASLLESRLQAESSAGTPASAQPPEGGTPAKHRQAAIDAARKAYEKAWCQGPPFAYAFGLANAKAHLDALGVEYPDMPPYDESLYDPMPDVPVIPPDEDGE